MNQTSNKVTSKDYFKAMQIVHLAMIAGLVLFMLVSAFFVNGLIFDQTDGDIMNIFMVVVPLLIFGGLFGSTVLVKNKLNLAKQKPNLLEKMSHYRSALIINFAMLEGPSFFAIVAYMLTGNLLFLGMAGLLLLVFFTIRPTTEKAIRDLELSQDEIKRLNDPNEFISETQF